MDKKRTFRTAIGWSFLMNLGQQGGSAIITLILAAILGIEAFGTVALANVFILFIQMILEQGFTSALIQRRDLREAHLNSVFWVLLAWSLLLMAGGILLSGWWASLFDDESLKHIIIALSLTIPIRALTVVQHAVLQRDMDFKSLAIRSSVAVLAGGMVGLPMALTDQGVWSLVGQQIVQAIVGLALLWRMSSWRPKMKVEWQAIKELCSFSVGMFLSSLAMFAHARADTVIIGLYFGKGSVGIYQMAYRLMNLAMDMGSRAVNSVALPELSRHQSDPAALRESAGRCLHVAAIFTIPLLGLLAALADVTLPLLGKNWFLAAKPVSLLCISGAVNATILFCVPLLNAVGRPHTNAALAWTWGALTCAISWGVAYAVKDWEPVPQIVSMAWSRAAISVLIHLPVYMYLAHQICGFSPKDFLRFTGPSLVSSLVAVTAAAGLRSIGLLENSHPIATFVTHGFIVTIVCVLTLFAIEPRAKEIGKKVFARISRK